MKHHFLNEGQSSDNLPEEVIFREALQVLKSIEGNVDTHYFRVF